jgi:hypothetical protein
MDGENTANSSARERQKAGLRPPWKPGETGNPGGASKLLKARCTAVQALVDVQQTPEMVAGVIEKLRQLAMQGSVPAAGMYLDRVVGPVKDGTEAVETNLSDAPPEVLEWLSTQGRGN